jgi:hypothetical protein
MKRISVAELQSQRASGKGQQGEWGLRMASYEEAGNAEPYTV